MKNRVSETLICDTMETIILRPETEREDILQCLKTIANVHLASVPMCRDVGTDAEPLHRREDVARTLITRNLYVAMRDQETRAEVRGIRFEESGYMGLLRPVLEVRLDG